MSIFVDHHWKSTYPKLPVLQSLTTKQTEVEMGVELNWTTIINESSEELSLYFSNRFNKSERESYGKIDFLFT
jgi:hypothetical protein